MGTSQVVHPFFCQVEMFAVPALRGPLYRLNRWSVNTCGLSQLSEKSRPVFSSVAAEGDPLRILCTQAPGIVPVSTLSSCLKVTSYNCIILYLCLFLLRI